MLTEPFSPLHDETVSFIVLEVNFISETFCVPDQHVVIDLHSFGIEHDVAEPVWNPRGAEHFMDEFLFVFFFRLDVLEKYDFEEMTLEENVD